jgi:hypothetical protein
LPHPIHGTQHKANRMFLSSKIARIVAALLLVLDSRPNGKLLVVVADVAADTSADIASALFPSTDTIVGVRRRHLELLQRLLQSSSSNSSSSSSSGNSTSNACQSQADTAQSCLSANAGLPNTTAGSACLSCYNLKQAEALDAFRNNPTLECTSLNDNVCTPVSECTCLEPCDNEVSAVADCSLKAAFANGGVQLNCTISCMGTNVSMPQDDFVGNGTDDFVSGLCISEKSSVKLCLESMGSSLNKCANCLATTKDVNVTTSTTCSELQVSTCDRINTCPCVKDCKTEMVALWNCDIDFSILDFPQLTDCNELEQCPNSGGGGSGSGGSAGGTSGASAALLFGGAASSWARFVFVAWALGKTVAAAALY